MAEGDMTGDQSGGRAASVHNTVKQMAECKRSPLGNRTQTEEGAAGCKQSPFKQQTLSMEKVSSVFKEPFILTGYRLPEQPWSYYLYSFFQLHNESVNVWSHSFLAVYVLAGLWGCNQTWNLLESKDGASIIGFCLGCFLGSSLSATAHLLHSKSSWWHYVLFMVDYGGVMLYTFGTGVGCIYICSQRHVYAILEPFFLPISVLLSWFTFYSLCKTKLRCTGSECSQNNRKTSILISVLIYAIVISVPVGGRYVECFFQGGCSLTSLNHLTSCFALIGLEGTLFYCSAPERFAPGRFDIFGHSHSLFHLVGTLAVPFQIEGVRVDIDGGAAAHAHPSMVKILGAYIILTATLLATIFCLRKEIDSKVTQEEKRDLVGKLKLS